MLRASWNAPLLTAASPKKQRHTWSPPRYLIAKPTPVAIGMCPPTMPWPPRKFVFAAEQVHRAALALRAAGGLAEQLGHHGPRRDAARDRLPVVAVGGDHVVVVAQHGDRAGADGFLSDVQVAEPADLAERVRLGDIAPRIGAGAASSRSSSRVQRRSSRSARAVVAPPAA